jgi:hypothetical protein
VTLCSLWLAVLGGWIGTLDVVGALSARLPEWAQRAMWGGGELRLPGAHLGDFVDAATFPGALRESEAAADAASLAIGFGPHRVGPEQIFFETGLSCALVNIKPVLPGHALVVSRRRCASASRCCSSSSASRCRSAASASRCRSASAVAAMPASLSSQRCSRCLACSAPF